MAPATATYRVMVADPHLPMARAVGELIARTPGMTLVASASDRSSVARLLARHSPDVLLLDTAALAGERGSALALLQQASPSTRIVLMAMDDGSAWAAEVDNSCAVGYLSKSSPAGAWLRAITSAAREQPPTLPAALRASRWTRPGHSSARPRRAAPAGPR